MKILIGGAWPYANGSLHIGHIAALLPGDVLARYHRAKGDEVYYISGSDCFGTPVAIRARQEGKSPSEISNAYHEEFKYCFNKLGFSYDLYGKTSSTEHQNFVRDFHKKLYESRYIYEKVTPQACCNNCHTALADRFVNGACPSCGAQARGDQCDACGAVLEPETLINPVCAVCGEKITFAETKHLFLAVTQLVDELKDYVNSYPNWRKNAAAFSNRYINEGLRDRALTRSLDWGITVPKEGWEDKKIYIWAENVLGYLSASFRVCIEQKTEFTKLWGVEAKHYYVHGKDNIPFHTIILPSLLLAHGETIAREWHLPDEIVSSEYLTLEGRKISTSRNWAVWVPDIIERYEPDSLRYFFIANGPERKDSDFSWRDYVNSHNGELVGAYGNLINRSLVFISKYLDNRVPEGVLANGIAERLESIYKDVGDKIEQTRFRDAIDTIFELVRFGNKYFDTEKPWETRCTDLERCQNTLYNCVQIIANLAVLLEPFLPFTSEKVSGWLKLSNEWKPQYISSGYELPEVELLFNRIDKKVIVEEISRLPK